MTLRGIFYALPLALVLWAIIIFVGYWVYTGLRFWL